ncbi:MAG: hypothetical protein A3K18_30245 [Lentisphaerae bacterium RIFOXYA12_64_32]|nr:MAG: hypothetical protein A3K18_30245 [Lentisphaerae bacterium RIFOXYA12_64_32]
MVFLVASVFGMISGFQFSLLRNAVWALLLMLTSCLVFVLIVPLCLYSLGWIYTLMFILMTIMRFGMEQAEMSAPGRKKAKDDGPHINVAMMELVERLEDSIKDMKADSPARKFMTMKVTDLPGAQKFFSLLRKVLPTRDRVGDMTEDASAALKDATTVLLEMHRSRGATWMYRLCGVGVVILAIIKAIYIGSGHDERDRFKRQVAQVAHRQVDYCWVTARYLGEHLAKTCPNEKVLIINGYVGEKGDVAYRQMMRGLSEGFGDKLTVNYEQAIPWDDVSTLTTQEPDDVQRQQQQVQADPMAALKSQALAAQTRVKRFSAQVFDEWVSRYPDCKIIISAGGLPTDFPAMKFWQLKPEERPKLFLLNANLKGLHTAIKQGLITGVVTQHPKGERFDKKDMEKPDDYKAIFERRFLLIQADNVDRVTEEFPSLLLAKM